MLFISDYSNVICQQNVLHFEMIMTVTSYKSFNMSSSHIFDRKELGKERNFKVTKITVEEMDIHNIIYFSFPIS